jgi:hypothetical protein
VEGTYLVEMIWIRVLEESSSEVSKEEQFMVELDLKGRSFSRSMLATLHYVVDGTGEEEDFFKCCQTCETKADGVHGLSNKSNRACRYWSSNNGQLTIELRESINSNGSKRAGNSERKKATSKTGEAARETPFLSVQEMEAAICGAATLVIKKGSERICQFRDAPICAKT